MSNKSLQRCATLDSPRKISESANSASRIAKRTSGIAQSEAHIAGDPSRCRAARLAIGYRIAER